VTEERDVGIESFDGDKPETGHACGNWFRLYVIAKIKLPVMGNVYVREIIRMKTKKIEM
jgi:hypothetical protein